MTVSITSDNLIGGARAAVTDLRGVYRFTLLPGGKYRDVHDRRVRALNVEGVNLSAGGAATINGKLDVGGLQKASPSPASRRRSTSSRRRSPSTGISRSSTSCRTARSLTGLCR